MLLRRNDGAEAPYPKVGIVRRKPAGHYEGSRSKKMVGAPVRRRRVACLQQGGLSVRRACALMSVARSTLHYESRLVKRDAPVVTVMRELASQYPRYGYRRIQVFLERRGHTMSADRTHRLWRRCGLQVPRKRRSQGEPVRRSFKHRR
jgi:putative transposase